MKVKLNGVDLHIIEIDKGFYNIKCFLLDFPVIVNFYKSKYNDRVFTKLHSKN